MNVLLLSMPDSFEHMPPVAIRMPNGALASLAGNVDPHHRVAIADLILVQASVRTTVERLVREIDAGRRRAVGDDLSARDGARDRPARPRSASIGAHRRRRLRSEPRRPRRTRSCAGGRLHRPRRRRAHALRAAARAGKRRRSTADIAGLSYRTATASFTTAIGRCIPLASSALRLPNRGARVLRGYTLLGRQVDVVETSRGCTFDCSFCSIIEMRGRNFHPYPIDRVLADIADARAHGAEAIFLVDDNITLDVERFEALCRAIVDAGFDDIDYIVQAMTAPIAQHGARLAPLMRRAGFRYVFLGIENILDEDLAFLRARAKNAQREQGGVRSATPASRRSAICTRTACTSSAA